MSILNQQAIDERNAREQARRTRVQGTFALTYPINYPAGNALAVANPKAFRAWKAGMTHGVAVGLKDLGSGGIRGLAGRLFRRRPLTPTQFFRVIHGW